MSEELLQKQIKHLRNLLELWLDEQDYIRETGEVDGDDHDQLVEDTTNALLPF